MRSRPANGNRGKAEGAPVRTLGRMRSLAPRPVIASQCAHWRGNPSFLVPPCHPEERSDEGSRHRRKPPLCKGRWPSAARSEGLSPQPSRARGILASRCRWQKKRGRNFRSRAVGGSLRSRPANGNRGKAEGAPVRTLGRMRSLAPRPVIASQCAHWRGNPSFLVPPCHPEERSDEGSRHRRKPPLCKGRWPSAARSEGLSPQPSRARGILASRCRWQKKRGRNFRSRAVCGQVVVPARKQQMRQGGQRKPERFFGHRKAVRNAKSGRLAALAALAVHERSVRKPPPSRRCPS